MSRAARSLLSALAAAVCAVQAPAQVARCELQQAEAYVGQEILYQVLLRDVKEAKLEKAPAVEGLSIALDSEGVVNVSKNVVIFNGVRTERETGDYVFRFLVRADQPGAYRIPPPPITVEGRPVTGNAVVLRVEAASAQDLAFLEMRADRTEVVRGERFQLTADVFLKHLPAPAPTPDPLSQHDSGRSLFDAGTPPPSVKLPWVPQPPLGLGGFDLNAWATPLLNARRGLVLEPLERNRFQGEIADVDRKDAAGTTAKYRRYRFAVTLRAENVGKYALPAATLEGQLVQKSASGEFRWRSVFARSEPVTVVVEEPPREGRPAAFAGAVGVFTLEMLPPTPTSLATGEPVYVTLIVRGEGDLDGIEIDVQRQVGDAFRVERPKVLDSLPAGATKPPGFPDRPGHWRQLEYKLRPLAPTVTSIPPLSFAYFDTRKRGYEVLTTEAVPLDVRPASSGESGVIAPSGESGRREAVELVPTSALSGNFDDLNLLDDQAPRAILAFAIALSFVPLYAAIALLVRRRRELARDPALLRRRGADGRARRRLAEAAKEAGAAPARAAEQALEALLGYVADRTNRTEEATTSGDLLAFVEREPGLAAETVAAVRRLAEIAEEARFGGAAGTPEEVQALIERVGGWPGRRQGTARSLVVKSLLAATLLAGASRGQDLDAFRRAQAAFRAGDYLGAAAHYEAMLAGGYENGYVLFNLGNAYLKAQELGEAIAAYRRAHRLIPNDANLAVNLTEALKARQQPISPSDERKVIDYVLFWRRGMPLRTQLVLLVAGALAAFALALVRLLLDQRHPFFRWTIVLCVLVALSMGVSAALDLRDREASARGVVTEPSVVLRRWAGADAEAAFEQPVAEGVEFQVLARQEGWLKVLLGDRFEGWLPESAARTY